MPAVKENVDTTQDRYISELPINYDENTEMRCQVVSFSRSIFRSGAGGYVRFALIGLLYSQTRKVR